jgi:hypothetical protein
MPKKNLYSDYGKGFNAEKRIGKVKVIPEVTIPSLAVLCIFRLKTKLQAVSL